VKLINAGLGVRACLPKLAAGSLLFTHVRSKRVPSGSQDMLVEYSFGVRAYQLNKSELNTAAVYS
jgi:hypothetical protein